MTRAELIAKADPICQRKIDAQNARKITAFREYGEVLPRVAASEQAVLADMAKITPPASMATDWQQILDDNRTIADMTAKIGAYAGSHENLDGARKLITKANEAQHKLTTLARKDGFKVCGEP